MIESPSTPNTDNFFNNIFNKIYFSSIIVIFIYAIFKEREEFGCSKLFTIKKQCNELNSIYLQGTYPYPLDTKHILIKKLKSILSIHLKYAVWRKCFIIGCLIILFTKGLNPDIKPHLLIGLHIITISILYFYHNFMNFHLYRLADNIGTLILNNLDNLNNSNVPILVKEREEKEKEKERKDILLFNNNQIVKTSTNETNNNSINTLFNK